MIARLYTILIVFFSFLFFSCSDTDKTTEADYAVVPIPRHINIYKDGPGFVMDRSTGIFYNEGDIESKQLADFLSEFIYESTGIKLTLTSEDKSSNIIKLQKQVAKVGTGYYKLNVTPQNIIIQAGDNAGLFYGIQTLRKSIPAEKTVNILFPSVEIEDYPRFDHRGVSLDVSRHFFSIEFVKKYIDVLAMYNMNVFHWHLTDDQGWRIEIKKYPELTKIGSQRSETAIDRHSEEYDGKPYGGFYTQEQIKEVVEYAAGRYITVIPEIDIPGHTLAVLTSYPHLGCTGGPYSVGRGWGIFEDVLCAGNDSVFTFLDDVFTEIVELFPSKYIHIGGDECLKNRWMACPKCQLRIKNMNIKGNKEHSAEEQLQSYFIHRVEEIINKKGRSIIGWDEILEGGIAPNATIMSWRGTEGGVYAAGKGHNVIMTPEAFVYLDYYQSAEVDKEPYTFGWLTGLDKVYFYDPLPHELPKEKQKYILGGQVNIWTEYMSSDEHVEYMLLPRMAAFAETLWSYPEQKNYNEFVSRMYKQSQILDKSGYKNCKQAYGVQANLDYDLKKHEVKATLYTFDNSPIYYTLDGTEPDEKSQRYIGTITINKSGILKAFTQRDGFKSDVYSKEFTFNKATARLIELSTNTDVRYTFNSPITLVDGQKGYKESYRTGSWLGFSGTDMEAVIKLDTNSVVSSVSWNNFVNTRGGLFAPEAVTVQISDDKKNYKTVFNQVYSVPASHIKPEVITSKVDFKEVNANYIKVILKNIKTLPVWHEKKGTKAYLMIDEITVE